jgi:hypothetical protein
VTRSNGWRGGGEEDSRQFHLVMNSSSNQRGSIAMQIDRTKKTATPTGVSAAVLMITGSLFSGMTHATPTYLSKVNSYCGASYSCSQCHTVDDRPNGATDVRLNGAT